jgi:hypothetical protein
MTSTPLLEDPRDNRVAMTRFSAEDLNSMEHDLESAIAAFKRAREEVRAVKRDRLRNPPGGAGA